MPDLIDPSVLAHVANKLEAEMLCIRLNHLGVATRIEQAKPGATVEFGRHYTGHHRVLVSAADLEIARGHLATLRAANGHG